MSLEIWFAFVAACSVMLVIPGPTILTVISYSMAHGRRAQLPLVAAVALGDSTALAVSLLGLGSLLAASAFWFTVVKWAGGLYLLYLAAKMLRAGLRGPAGEGERESDNESTSKAAAAAAVPAAPGSLWKLFANTYLVTALNPKGIVFFVAFLPQFIRPGAPIAQQLWILAATFVTLATVNATAYAVCAGASGRLLASPRAQRRFHLAGGSLLGAAGIWALMARRPA